MAPLTIQRNAIVAPFSVNSPLLEKSGTMRRAKEKGVTQDDLSDHKVAITHQKWFTQVQTGINASPQITAAIPVSSSSPGEPGTIAFDSNWLYVCVGNGIWRRAALNIF